MIPLKEGFEAWGFFVNLKNSYYIGRLEKKGKYV
jgi:hypothetical protein